MKKKMNVLMSFDLPYSVPEDHDFKDEFKDPDWASESNIYKALKRNGHNVKLLGVKDDLNVLIEEIQNNKPDVVFNLTEVFKGRSNLDKNVVWLLEMFDVPYTGASSTTLLLCNNKALSKKILSYHRIKTPHFNTFYKGHKIWLPKRLKTPLVVKPLCDEASRGISQSSVVDNEQDMIERVKFIHEKMDSHAIVEEYIDGRELYVGILGNRRMKMLSPIEMRFSGIPEDEPRIATYKAKWDAQYRKKWGIRNIVASRLPDEINRKVEETCKRAYRALNMQCYARFDVRLTKKGDVYILEANANPCIARDEDFGQSAEKAGIPYEKLVNRILDLAFKRVK